MIRYCVVSLLYRSVGRIAMEDIMEFASVRVITDDITRLVKFYEDVTGLAPTWYTPDFAELATPACTLAIGSTSTMAMFGAGAARPADHHTAIIEFRVHDVDGEYRKLETIASEVVQEPTTMPWGNRSVLFRDPDGNLVNLFTPATEDAINRLREPLPGTNSPLDKTI